MTERHERNRREQLEARSIMGKMEWKYTKALRAVRAGIKLEDDEALEKFQ